MLASILAFFFTQYADIAAHIFALRVHTFGITLFVLAWGAGQSADILARMTADKTLVALDCTRLMLTSLFALSAFTCTCMPAW